tara:strand:+ start:347 stop:475 length:129 start_codon:yes stop_codon:yes gene_type:complete
MSWVDRAFNEIKCGVNAELAINEEFWAFILVDVIGFPVGALL